MSENDATADQPTTCGQGLAAHASVPGKVSELLHALADNLDAHVPTIDTSAPEGRQERDAYEHLVSEYTAIATRLRSTAERMRGYRSLPAAPHHEEALGDPKLLDLSERFVRVEAELAQLLSDAAERDHQLLRQGGP